MTYIQVNIGRNVGIEPMSDTDWNNFIDTVLTMISRHSTIAPGDIEVHTGTGHYNGIAEESAHISAWAEDPQIDVESLKPDLRLVASQYGQDTVALIITESELI